MHKTGVIKRKSGGEMQEINLKRNDNIEEDDNEQLNVDDDDNQLNNISVGSVLKYPLTARRKRKIAINVSDERWTNGRPVSGKYSNAFVHLLDYGKESEFLRCNLCNFYCLDDRHRQTNMKRHWSQHINKTEEMPKLNPVLHNKLRWKSEGEKQKINLMRNDSEDDHDYDGPNVSASSSGRNISPIKKKAKMPINISDARWTNGRPVSGKYSDMFVHLLDSGKESEFLRCVWCNFYCVLSRQSQTYMKRHRNLHIKTEEIPRLETELLNKQVSMALKGRSFLSLADQSLYKLMGAFGKLSVACAKIGVPCNVEDKLMSGWSLSRRVRDLTLTDERRTAFLELVELVKTRGTLTFAYGLNRHDILVLIAHVIDKYGALKQFVLHFAEWTDASKKPQNIDEMISWILEQYHFDQRQMQLLGSVTDEGSNGINCFGFFGSDKIFRVRCFSEIVDTITKHTLASYAGFDNVLDQDSVNEVLVIVKQVESFVRDARKIAVVVDNCGPCLYEPTDTQWISLYKMCHTFVNSVEEIRHVFSVHINQLVGKHIELCNQFRRLAQNDILLIGAFVEVLRPLYEALPKLEDVKTPAMNTMIRTLSSFLLHLDKTGQEFAEETPKAAALTRAAKHALLRKIEKSLNVKLLKCAAFLDPLELRRVRAICGRVAIWGTSDSFKQATLEIFNSSGIDDVGETESLIHENEEFPLENPKLDVESEIDAYVGLTLTIDPKEFDVLSFWNTTGKMFPLLHQLALKVLAIPCSNAHSGNAVSRLRHLSSSYRQFLSSDTISEMICLGSLEFDELFDEI